jgi:hypothetical protein
MNDIQKPTRTEPPRAGLDWKSPYVLYILLTTLLFGALVFIGWLALQNGWIPNRGVS